MTALARTREVVSRNYLVICFNFYLDFDSFCMRRNATLCSMDESDDLFNILMVVLAAVGFASLAVSVKTLMMIAEMSGKLSGL